MIKIILMLVLLLFSIIVYLLCRKFKDKLPAAITLAVVSVMVLGFSIYNGITIEKGLAAAESQEIEEQTEEEAGADADVEAEDAEDKTEVDNAKDAEDKAEADDAKDAEDKAEVDNAKDADDKAKADDAEKAPRQVEKVEAEE